MVLVGDFFSFVLSDNVCTWPIKIKLSLSESNPVRIYQALIWRGSVCIHKNMCIHKYIYVCIYTYTGEKKEVDLLQMQSLFFNKGVNCALNTSFHILV